MSTLVTTPLPLAASSLRHHLTLMPSFPLPSPSPSPSPITPLNLSMQVEDILIKIFSELDLYDLQAMRLVSRRLRSLVDAKVVWVELLKRLELPLPLPYTRDGLSDVDAWDLQRVAVHSVRLHDNWRSSSPKPTFIKQIPLDSAVLAMTRCAGVTFTAHKDGRIRCWRDLDSPLSQNESGKGREDSNRFLSITPKEMTKFTCLQVAEDRPRSRFIVVYAGDATQRRTLCGVHYVSMDLTCTQDPEGEGLQFEETKGIVSMAVTPSAVAVARSQGNITITPLSGESSFCINPEPILGTTGGKILRVQAIEGNKLLVVTSDAVAVYPMPTHEQPHVGLPTWTRALPRSSGAWVQQATSSPSSSSYIISLLTSDNAVIRLSYDTHTHQLLELSRDQLPYAPEPQAITDLQGGVRRPVWVHWRRGADGWPVHVFGGNHNNETGGDSGVPTASSPLRSLAAVSSEDEEPVGQLSEVIFACTRSCSMPRVCFDEGSGRMVVAGFCSASLAVVEFA